MELTRENAFIFIRERVNNQLTRVLALPNLRKKQIIVPENERAIGYILREQIRRSRVPPALRSLGIIRNCSGVVFICRFFLYCEYE